MLDQIPQIAIIGPGLLGASVGLALKKRGYAGRIVATSRRVSTAERARELGCVDEVAESIPAAVARSNLVVIAVPLGAFKPVFRQLAGAEHDSLVITDVGSTKQEAVALARDLLYAPQRFVGAHPMAGSEQQGPDAATADLFEAKPCILTPESDTAPQALEIVDELWRGLGMNIIEMSAAEHDAQTAVISHLPHAVAVMLVHVAMQQGGWDLASTGFRDTTRLASSNPPMRADIISTNRAAICESLQALRQQVDVLIEVLGQDNAESLLDWLNRAKDARDQWTKLKRDQ